MRRFIALSACAAALLSITGSSGDEGGVAAAVGTGFTYQGRLLEDGLPANGAYDVEFTLHTEPTGTGSQVGSPVVFDDQPAGHGLFTVALDFGDAVQMAESNRAIQALQRRLRQLERQLGPGVTVDEGDER